MKLKDRADLLTQFIRQISEEQWGEIDGIFSNGATERDTLQRRTYETLRRALMGFSETLLESDGAASHR